VAAESANKALVVPAVSERQEMERRADRDLSESVAGIRKAVLGKAKTVIDSVDDATLRADVAEPRKSVPMRTAFLLKLAENAMAAESAAPAVQINIQQVYLPPQEEPDYTDVVVVELDRGDD
jgi:hypothetical protein